MIVGRDHRYVRNLIDEHEMNLTSLNMSSLNTATLAKLIKLSSYTISIIALGGE